MKRMLALLLAALMLLSVVGCAGNEGTGKETSGAAETTAPADTTDPAETEDDFYADRNNAKDSLPENLNFNDADIRILAQGESCGKPEVALEFFTDKDSTDIVNDAVIKRNAYVEERLGIKMVLIDGTEGDNGMMDKLRTSVFSFSNDYDFYSDTHGSVITGAEEGLMYDLYDTEYLDFEKPWWNSTYIDALTLDDGRVFVCTGELATTLLSNNFISFFNKAIWNDYHADVDLYQMVRDGNWTLDAFTQYANVYRDLNSDGVADVEDLYGNVLPYGTTQAYAWGAGSMIRYTTQDEETGDYYYTFLNDHTSSFMEKMRAILFRNNITYISENNEMDTDEQLMAKIKADTSLFTLAKMNCVQYLRDMDSDFGIVPLPKYDEQQEKYTTAAHHRYTGFGIVSSTDDPDMISAFMEASCAEAYRYVTPAYYDTAVKFKYSRDVESAEMLDICTGGITMDLAYMIGGGGGVLMDVFVSEKMLDKYVSYVGKKIKSYESDINDAFEKMNAVE